MSAPAYDVHALRRAAHVPGSTPPGSTLPFPAGLHAIAGVHAITGMPVPCASARPAAGSPLWWASSYHHCPTVHQERAQVRDS